MSGSKQPKPSAQPETKHASVAVRPAPTETPAARSQPSVDQPDATDAAPVHRGTIGHRHPVEMTAAQAAALVQRRVDAQEGLALLPVQPEEVLQFRDYGTHVIVVTADGQKFSSADAYDVAGDARSMPL